MLQESHRHQLVLISNAQKLIARVCVLLALFGSVIQPSSAFFPSPLTIDSSIVDASEAAAVDNSTNYYGLFSQSSGLVGIFRYTGLSLPLRDNFSDRVVLDSERDDGYLPDGVEFRLRSSTSELDEPLHAGRPGGLSQWVSWTARRSERVLIDTLKSNLDTLLGVYSGDALANLVEIASNDDAGGLYSQVEFDAQAGHTYHIAVDGYAGSRGEGRLRISRGALRVPEDFNSIDAAMRAADQFDTIRVAPGAYMEHLDFLEAARECKTLHLFSSDGPGVTWLEPRDPAVDLVRLAGCKAAMIGFSFRSLAPIDDALERGAAIGANDDSAYFDDNLYMGFDTGIADSSLYRVLGSLPSSAIQFAARRVHASETDSIVQISIERVRPEPDDPQPVQATLIVSSGTAIAGEDFIVAEPQLIEFAQGEAGPKLVQIELINDHLAEFAESIQLRLEPIGDADLANAQLKSEIIIAPDGADLGLEWTVETISGANHHFEFEFTAHNAGLASARQSTLRIDLPESASELVLLDQAQSLCSELQSPNRHLHCELGDLAVDQQQQIAYQYQLDPAEAFVGTAVVTSLDLDIRPGDNHVRIRRAADFIANQPGQMSLYLGPDGLEVSEQLDPRLRHNAWVFPYRDPRGGQVYLTDPGLGLSLFAEGSPFSFGGELLSQFEQPLVLVPAFFEHSFALEQLGDALIHVPGVGAAPLDASSATKVIVEQQPTRYSEPVEQIRISTELVASGDLFGRAVSEQVQLDYVLGLGRGLLSQSATHEDETDSWRLIGDAPAIVSPEPASTLSSTSVNFTLDLRELAVEQWWLYIGSEPGARDRLDSGPLSPTDLQYTASDLPTLGQALFVRLFFYASERWYWRDYRYQALSLPLPEFTIDSLQPLDSRQQRFSWHANGQPVQRWQLYLGSAHGAQDITTSPILEGVTAASGTGAASEHTVAKLPTDGRAVHARLWYEVENTWHFVDQQFQAAGPFAAPDFGASDCPLIEDNELELDVFDNDNPVESWWLQIGTRAGGSDLHNSGPLSASLERIAVSDLPVDGRLLNLRLWYRINGQWAYSERLACPSAERALPQIDSPSTAVKVGADVDFSWTLNGHPAERCQLYLGSTAGARDLFDSGALSAQQTTVSVSGIPVDGGALHARLWCFIKGQWHHRDQQWTRDDLRPEILAPQANSILTGASASFEWHAPQTDITRFWLYIGRSVGAHDVFDSGPLNGTTTELTAAALPLDGSILYATLWFERDGIWAKRSQRLSAADRRPSVSALTSAQNQTSMLEWTRNAIDAEAWWVYVGRAPGTRELYDSGALSADTRAVMLPFPTPFPSALNVRLWYRINGRWFARDQQF